MQRNPSQIVGKLSKAGITNCWQFVTSSPLVLKKIGLDALEIAYVHSRLEESVASTPVTAKDMLDSKCDTLVLSSHRGSNVSAIFATGFVTELTGPPLVGKTFLCVDLTIRCIINSIHKRNHSRVEAEEKGAEQPPISAFYIDTKKKFDSRSGLVEKCEKIVDECAAQKDPADMSPDIGVNEVVPSFRIKDVKSSDDLLAWFASEELQMEVSMSEVAVIVIDSLSFLLSHHPPDDGDSEGFVLKLTAVLRRLAESCNCPVVITTSIPIGTFIREERRDSTGIRDTYLSTFTQAPTLQHCIQARQILLFDSFPNPTVPALDLNGRRCLLSEMTVDCTQQVSHFDLDGIGELLSLG